MGTQFCRENKSRGRARTERGIALLELAIVLPVLALFIFGIIDFGRLIQARLIITNVSREGGSLASREIKVGADLGVLLQSSASPLDMGAWGKIYVSRIKCGVSDAEPDPVIDSHDSCGNLAVASVIGAGQPRLGLSPAMYNHLVYNNDNRTADLSELTVVEVYYKYRPITPLPAFAQNVLLGGGDGFVFGSRAVF